MLFSFSETDAVSVFGSLRTHTYTHIQQQRGTYRRLFSGEDDDDDVEWTKSASAAFMRSREK